MNQQQTNYEVSDLITYEISGLNFCIFIETCQSIHYLENLSDEIFIEIFDYLDSYEIYHRFSKLNYRFQQLLNSSSMLLKVTHDDSKYNYYKQFLRNNKYRILSMKFQLGFERNHLFSSLIIDSTFHNLKSISINAKTPDTLIPVLKNFSSLPHLFSLKMDLFETQDKLTTIYQLVFALPKLKSFVFFLTEITVPDSLSIPTNQQPSPIEYLSIPYVSSADEYFWILSHTPRVHYLKLFIDIDTNMETLPIITLPNLTTLSILIDKYHDFNAFIPRIHGNFKVLRFSTGLNIHFLHAYQWENFISKSLPQLEEFHLRYSELVNDRCPAFIGEINQFSSSFWTERQWTLDVECFDHGNEYLIRPHRNRWYNYPLEKIFINSSQSTRLIIKCLKYDHVDQFIINCITRLSTLAQIYHLELLEKTISTNALIQNLKYLPDLDTLKIHSLSVDRSTIHDSQDSNTSSSTSNPNRITKIYLENMEKIEELDFLLEFCPHLVYLKIGAMKRTDLQFDLRHIDQKIKHGDCKWLRLLCFHIPTVDDEMIENLRKLIQSEKVLCNCRIKRVVDQIYFEW